jgi:hypothetical protein
MTDLFKAPMTPVDGNVETLAKSKYEADRYIKTLEEKADELQRDLKTRMSLEEFMTKNLERTQESNRSSNQNSNENQHGDSNNATPQTMSEEQIAALVAKAVATEQSKLHQNTNVETVRQEMMKHWGNSYTNRLQERATELGVGPEFLNELAARSPKAFLSVVGLASAAPKGSPNASLPPGNRVNSDVNFSSGSNTSNVRDSKFYNKMRAENPKQYYSADTTVQRHKDAIAMGEAFFKD